MKVIYNENTKEIIATIEENQGFTAPNFIKAFEGTLVEFKKKYPNYKDKTENINAFEE